MAFAHAASSNAGESQPSASLRAHRHASSETSFTAGSFPANRISRQAIRPAGLAVTLAGLFSATMASTFVPGLSSTAEPRQIACPCASPHRSRASARSAAPRTSRPPRRAVGRAAMVLPSGRTKARRKNRLASGRILGRVAFRKPKPLAALEAQRRFAGEGSPLRVRLEAAARDIARGASCRGPLAASRAGASPRSTGSCRSCRRAGTGREAAPGRLHCQMPLAP